MAGGTLIGRGQGFVCSRRLHESRLCFYGLEFYSTDGSPFSNIKFQTAAPAAGVLFYIQFP